MIGIAAIVGLIIGICICWIVKLLSKPVYKYPTLNNIRHTVYHDENGICYKYYAKEVKCV